LVVRNGPHSEFAAIERQISGRLGVAVLDVSTRRGFNYRSDERFPLCSTFKLLLAAQVLSLVDAGRERLARAVSFSDADLLDYAPITRAHVGEGSMTVSELIAAAVQYSDNTAANLLLRAVGGPSALTAHLRTLGDAVTRLDRLEPDLNTALPGDLRDTTTPKAMVADLERLMLGNHLTVRSRDSLRLLLLGNTTGAARLRAGLPPAWRVGDKTGTGSYGTSNDVAIIWPSKGGALLVAAYITESTATPTAREAALAAVGRTVARWATV
jgi:beta-lactamase class A